MVGGRGGVRGEGGREAERGNKEGVGGCLKGKESGKRGRWGRGGVGEDGKG